MQKRSLSLFAAAAGAVMLFASCSKDNKQGRYIPETAGAVFHINGESLNEKLPWDEVKQNEAFKKMSADTTVPAFAKAIMDNPENSGVNTKSDLEIFLMKDSAGAYAGMEGFIKDDAKFKKFLTDANKNLKESSKDGFTYLTDEKGSAGFNKERFIITINLPQMTQLGGSRSSFPTDSSFGMQEIKYDRDMMGVTTGLLNLKEDLSLAKNDKFSDLMSTKGDMHMWYSAEHLNLTQNMGAMSAVANLKKLTEGAVFTGTVNFEDGKISFDGKSYGSKDMTDIYKKYSRSSFDNNMLKNIPSKNLAGMFIMSFDPQAIMDILKLLGLDGLANIAMAQAGLTLDDIVKATKGDLMIAVTDLKPDTDTTAKEKAQYIFSASIGDKASFNKLMDAAKKYAPMMGAADDSGPSYNMNDKYFAFSNSKATTDTYLAGKANTSFSFTDKISGGPMGGYVDFQYIFSAMKPADQDSTEKAGFDAASKLFDNMVINGGNFSNGAISQHWELNLMDKKTNSLKQLNTFIGTMTVLEQEKNKKREESWKTDWSDSAVVMPLPSTVPAVPAH